jgi:hypothetical protein
METAGRVPARAGRQLLALAQDDISTTELREMIQNATSDDPSPDNNNLRVGFHDLKAGTN